MSRLLLLVVAGLAHATDPGIDPGQGMIEGIPPGEPPPPEQVEHLTREIASGLRCPVCQGLSVADSTSSAAIMFQRRIAELVAAGYEQEQIEDYFVDRYGDWVLLDPPAQGLNWLIWITPALAGGAGLAWAMTVATGWRKEPDAAPHDTGGDTPRDPYERALLAELDE